MPVNNTEVWVKGCLAKVILKALEQELTSLDHLHPQVQELWRNAYRQAAALAATMEQLKERIK